MKIYAIARNTFSEAIRQPVVYLIAFIGVVMLVFSFIFTLFTFSEENTVKMIKDMGLATITLCALLVALFSASSVIWDEIEKKTALTVLCKPVTRFEFLVGKFLGVVLMVACTIVTLMAVFIVALRFYEHKWDFLLAEGAVFSFLQVAVLTSVAVAISTRFPLVVNVAVCFLLYVAGHASSYIVAEANRSGAFVRTCAHVLAIVFPNLESLNVATLAAKGVGISISCLAFGLLYAVLYIVAVLALALIALERREIM